MVADLPKIHMGNGSWHAGNGTKKTPHE